MSEEPNTTKSAPEQERQHLRWYGDGYVAKLLAGQTCSICSAKLEPSGVEIVGTVVRLLCSGGCHTEVFAVDTFGGHGVTVDDGDEQS